MTEYVVQPGDNLSKIARAHGLRSWREVYFHPDNEEFRRQHPDPSLIRPGDRVMIPDKTETVTLPQNVPQLLRLPLGFANQLGISRLLPLAPSSPSVTSSATSSSQLSVQILDPNRMNLSPPRPPAMPRRPLSWFGTGRPRPFGSCGPWGCARGPFDLDLPRPGTFGDLGRAAWSVPYVQNRVGELGDYLWTNAPPGRRWAVGATAGVTIAGAVTAFVTSDAIRSFTLEQLNDVDLPVGEAILLIPGVDNQRWVRSVLSPIKFSLIWQEPGTVSGPSPVDTPRGFQGQGGLLILDLQELVDQGN